MNPVEIPKHKYNVGDFFLFKNYFNIEPNILYKISSRSFDNQNYPIYVFENLGGWWTEEFIDNYKVEKVLVLNTDGFIEMQSL